jgi:hypothetical protein
MHLPSEEDRRRILAEEEFRRITAAKLDRELTPAFARWVRRLSAPFVLWLLSTVLVGLVSVAYTRWEDSRQRRAEERRLRGVTSAELYFRLSSCDGINATSDREDVETLLSSAIGARPLYNEYKDTRLDAVYLQYCLHGGGCATSPDTVLAATERIRLRLKPVIKNTPIGNSLTDRSFLQEMRRECDRLLPVKDSIRGLMGPPVRRRSTWWKPWTWFPKLEE